MRARPLQEFSLAVVEAIFLFALWILFVSETKVSELLAGVCAAIIGAVADAVVKNERFAKFRPQMKWLWLFLWEPWYVLKDSALIIGALARRLAGKKSQAQFRVARFNAGGDDDESAAHRALTIVLNTIPPNSIVVGVDKERKFLLLHQVFPSDTPAIAKRLGVRS